MKEQRDLKHEAEAMLSSLLHSVSNDPSRFKGKRLRPHRTLNSLETEPYTISVPASLTGRSLLHFMQCYHLLTFRSRP